MTYALAEQKLALIPEQYLGEVCDYLDALHKRITTSQPSEIKKHRTPGIMKGHFYMSDDFDEPLDDFKEYM